MVSAWSTKWNILDGYDDSEQDKLSSDDECNNKIL